MKRLQMYYSTESIYNFTDSEEIFIGWKEIPYSPRLINLINEYEAIKRELKALEVLFETELERLESEEREDN